MRRKIRVQDGETGTRLSERSSLQGVDFRDEVRHSEKTNQLFVKMMKADGNE